MKKCRTIDHIASTKTISQGLSFNMRHTFCTNLLLSGADISDVKDLVGHSDIRMMDRDIHSTLEMKPYLQERFARYYAGVLKKGRYLVDICLFDLKMTLSDIFSKK